MDQVSKNQSVFYKINQNYIYQKSYSIIIVQNQKLNSMKINQNLETQPGSSFNSPRFHMNEVLAKFSPAFTRNEQARYITEEVILILSDPNWFIRENYHSQKWMQIFQFIEESYCRRFFLMQTGVPRIIEQISKIKFSCLKQIDLSHNKITNVEIIAFLKIPHIKNLVLKNNLIVNINPLRRGKWKNLEVLDIEGNFVLQWRRIFELQINKQLIEYFSIQFVNSENLPHIEEIARLYPKISWNYKAEKIDQKIQMFGKMKEHPFSVLNSSIIQLATRKYEALKRKFQKNQ